MLIKNISNIVNNKIDCNMLNNSNYISTENMLENFGGIRDSSSIPSGKCTAFLKNDILLSNIRPYFKKLWFSKIIGGCSNDVIAIRANNKFALPKYIFYALSSNKFFSTYVANCKGTKMPRGNKDVLLNYEIPTKKLSEQQHIVDTIGSVDDLIEKYEKIDAKIINLLSMRFKAIKIKNNSIKLENFAYYQEGPGIRNWQYVDGDGVKFINIRCINDNDMQLNDANMISKEEAYGIYKHFMVQEDDILVSTSGTLGRLAIARKEHLPLCMNTSVIRFRPLIKGNYPYLFCFLMSDEFKNLILSMANGSAQLNFGPTHIKRINLLLPSKSELKTFNIFAQPLINKHKYLLSRIDKLKQIKTILLQKYFG